MKNKKIWVALIWAGCVWGSNGNQGKGEYLLRKICAFLATLILIL